MSRIFVSYRRNDVPDMVGRIYDNLSRSFRRHEIFKDVDSIRIGMDFRIVIHEALEHCRIVLVAIGPNWLNSQNERGQRRLEDPDDFVRLELESAFARGATIIPLLIGGAEMPPQPMLPETLRRLTFLQALPVRRDPDFERDFHRLKREIERVLPTKRRRGLILVGAAAGVAALAAVIWLFGTWWMAPSPRIATTQLPANSAQTPQATVSEAPPNPAPANPSIVAEQPGDREKATAAANAVMRSIAKKEFGLLWDTQTSDWYKKLFENNRESFLANAAITRGQFGTLTSSKLLNTFFSTLDPSTGFKGKIYTMNFSNAYDTGNFYERVVLIEEAGRFVMSGHHTVPAP